MRKPEADAWAFDVLSSIERSAPFETTHVELKAIRIEPEHWAKQLAGLANAARWHPILLLLGVDQKKGIVGIEPFEVGDWYSGLRAHFEYGEVPTLLYQNFLTFQGKTVGAFVFSTDNPPYVIAQGKKGGPRTVPWRFGSNTGVAGRAELLQVLLQRTAEPEFEILKAELRLTTTPSLQLLVQLFAYPAAGAGELVVPFHRIAVTASDDAARIVELKKSVSLVPPRPSSLAKLVDSAVLVPSASKLELTCFSEDREGLDLNSPVASVNVSIRPAHFEKPLGISMKLSWRKHPDYAGYWELPEDHSKRLHTFEDELRKLEHVAPRSTLRIPRMK